MSVVQNHVAEVFNVFKALVQLCQSVFLVFFCLRGDRMHRWITRTQSMPAPTPVDAGGGGSDSSDGHEPPPPPPPPGPVPTSRKPPAKKVTCLDSF